MLLLAINHVNAVVQLLSERGGKMSEQTVQNLRIASRARRLDIDDTSVRWPESGAKITIARDDHKVMRLSVAKDFRIALARQARFHSRYNRISLRA